MSGWGTLASYILSIPSNNTDITVSRVLHKFLQKIGDSTVFLYNLCMVAKSM